MELYLKEKVALVVASSQGLGKAIAEQLVEEGANVMLTSRDAVKLEAVQKELQEKGKGRVAFFQADITNADDIKALVQKTREVGS